MHRIAIAALAGVTITVVGGDSLSARSTEPDGGAPAAPVGQIVENDPPNESALVLLLNWARPGGRITIFDRKCQPIRVTREADALVGKIHVNRSRTMWFDISLGANVTITGPSGRSALAALWSAGGAIEEVKEDAAWFYPTHPSIFRTRKACLQYRKQHVGDPDDPDW